MTPELRTRPAYTALYTVGFGVFVLLGLLQAAYGPAYPLLETRFAQSVSSVAGISSAHFGGSALGPVILGALLTRVPLRAAMMLASAALALGLLVLALAPTWPVALAGAALAGLGFGAISGGLNSAFALLGAGPSSLVNALFGIGSVAAPLLALGLGAFPLPFFVTAALATLLALSLRSVRQWPSQPAVLAQRVVNRPQVALFGLLFFSYVGIEAGLGNWATTHLRATGNPEVVTSLYWLALTLGRLGFAPFGTRLVDSRFGPAPVVLACAAVALLGSLIVAVPALAPAGYLIAGLGIAPIFSVLLAWFTSRFPARVAPLMLSAGSLGGAAIPAVIGLLVARFGVQAVPYSVAADALLLGGSVLWVREVLRRSDAR
ncbi:MFS transporter [Deinococcus sp.]|uniref:MFS transporter n=1 Tax=Deinococcus sp. TaxID=47478 RepID=UPI0025EE9C92|nr:MFS transporter [Deinococcus sp.]